MSLSFLSLTSSSGDEYPDMPLLTRYSRQSLWVQEMAAALCQMTLPKETAASESFRYQILSLAMTRRTAAEQDVCCLNGSLRERRRDVNSRSRDRSTRRCKRHSMDRAPQFRFVETVNNQSSRHQRHHLYLMLQLKYEAETGIFVTLRERFALHSRSANKPVATS